MPEPNTGQLRRMRQRVEEMLVEGQRDGQVVDMLEKLVGDADEGSDIALFAHRQLAELRLEDSPWQAALHLRRLLGTEAADDGVHALMGLCHALMGNFRSAVSSYRRALQASPNNPWYHHNLGHLLDVGLARPEDALPHLRKAHELRQDEDEVAASLAHCLARLGELTEAEALAKLAVECEPDHREHRDILAWIREGAPGQVTPSGSRTAVARPGRSFALTQDDDATSEAASSPDGIGLAASAEVASGGNLGSRNRAPTDTAPTDTAPTDTALTDGALTDDVAAVLTAQMQSARHAACDIKAGLAMWQDFQGQRAPRVTKPEVFAAALEYAVLKVLREERVSQADVARRYGVGASSVAQRFAQIRDGLELVVADARYR